MNLLALETCTEPGSVALARNNQLLEVRSLPDGWQSTTLHNEIAALLARHALSIRQIDGYGVTIGPGSFTGVRVGLTAVKGIAEILQKPIAAVSTLETIAASGIFSESEIFRESGISAESGISNPRSVRAVPAPESGIAPEFGILNPESAHVVPSAVPAARQLVAAVLDARRGQIFGALYAFTGPAPELLVEEMVCPMEHFLDRLQSALRNSGTAQDGVLFCGTDLTPFAPAILARGWQPSATLSVGGCLAGPLARIAAERLQRGLGVDAAVADANYIRPSDAEMFRKE